MSAMNTSAAAGKRRKKELDTTDLEIGQKDDIAIPIYGEFKQPVDIVTLPSGVRDDEKAYLEELAFNEEPITIHIHHSSERNAPPCTDLVANNGRWAEMLVGTTEASSKWVAVGYLPRGRNIVTKRKYAMELARSKQDNVTTQIMERNGEDPQNLVKRVTSAKFPFSVIEDKNPRGAEWLRIMLYT
jgi:hypothetical protein